MLHRLGIVAALASWAAPLGAQVGLASAPAAIALSARKSATVAVTLSGIGPAGPRSGPRLDVTTTWSLDPDRTGPLAVLAVLERPAGGTAGGAKRAAMRGGGTIVLFLHATGPGGPGGRTDELHLERFRTGALDLRVTTQ